MKRSKPAQQGTADGLCGLYCLLNFLQNTPQFEKDPSRAYQQLVLAADKCGVLTPWHICEGFQWFDLVAIFNIVATNYRMPFVARPIAAIAHGLKETSPSKVIQKVIEAGGAAVIHINDGGHWILAHRLENADFVVDDSGRSGEHYILKRAGLTRRGTDAQDGVAILPSDSEMSTWP